MTKQKIYCVIGYLACFLVFELLAEQNLDCFADHDNPYCRLGSKTPYRFVANHDPTPPFFEGCREQKIWMIVRHGTRYPVDEHIETFKKNLPILRDRIIQEFEKGNSQIPLDLIRELGAWKMDFNTSYSEILAEEGAREMTGLGFRTRTRFPALFSDVSPGSYKIECTPTQRTEQSAKYFVYGLFGEREPGYVQFSVAEENDPILRFYKKCPRWITRVKENPETYKEKKLFSEGPSFERLLNDLSWRVGFPVNYENATAMHTMCQFQIAWNQEVRSPWCQLFSPDDIKVFEFEEDLEYYSVHGHKYNISYQQACPVLVDMFNFLESNNKTRVSAYFTHSGAVLKTLSLLGFGKDKNQITHDAFYRVGDLRKWRVSQLDAFGSNLAVVLYDCADQGKSVIIMHQERPVSTPECPFNRPCPLHILKRLYPDNNAECRFDKMCSLEKEPIRN